MISRVSQASVLQGFVKSRSFLAGNSAYIPSSYESIATATGTGSSGTITFSSIPQTYTHLQIRGIIKTDNTGSVLGAGNIVLNSDTGANYTRHRLVGDGATAYADGATGNSNFTAGIFGYANTTANIVGVGIVDILDYTSTSKYKTMRSFTGREDNLSNGLCIVESSLWLSTSAITSITINVIGGTNFTTQTTLALYGIKAA